MAMQRVIDIHLTGTYRRRVGASLERIWENVLDWEHLPALHAGSFAAVELIEADAGGWRISLTQAGNTPRAQVLRLETDKAQHRYWITTEAGPAASSEIRVALAPHGRHDTSVVVVVEYHVPVADPERRATIGARFVAAYQTLWDEDEAMMRAREAALAPAARTPPPQRVEIGPAATLVLPLVFAFGAERFRLVALDGRLIAHSVTCPHWLGPLDQAVIENGCIRCPWHGYRFDVATGRSADGRGMRLAPAPAIGVENGVVVARRA